MEVHAHTHIPTGRGKKWTHYFWEFLMLFLAVTLGFFVENQREHFIENKREKEYIRSMIEDLMSDTTGFADDNATRRDAIMMYDSVIILLGKNERNETEQQRIYYLARMGLRLSPFPKLNDRTYEQMKSSGNLRLIHHKDVADKITKYYFNSKEFAVNTSQSLLRLQSLIEAQGQVFNGTVFQQMTNLKDFSISQPTGYPALISSDKKTLNELVIRIHYVLSILLYTEKIVFDMKGDAALLIENLQKEYHL